MAERYSRVFSLPTERYAPGCPVVLAAGALLKDAVTGGVVAQLKFRNISGKAIIGMKVRITPFDLAGKQLGDAEQNYLDMTVPYGVEFGQKTAVCLPDASARKYEVVVTQVVFADSTVLEQEFSDWQPLPDKIPLDTWLGSKEMAKQYRLQFGENCAYQPQKEENVWVCTCGSVNPAENQSCAKCGKAIDALISADLGALKAAADERLAAEEAQKDARKKKTKSILTKVTIVLGAALAMVVLYIVVISPAIAYGTADKLEAQGEYVEAWEAFNALGDYRDAQERALQVYFKRGLELFDKGSFVEAKEIFLALEDYREISDYVVAADYNIAKMLFDERRYEEARKLFDSLGDYQDAQERAREAYIYEALTYETLGEYGKACLIYYEVGENERAQKLQKELSKCISAGSSHVLGLKSDGTVVAVGGNEWDQCNVTKWHNIVAVEAGFCYSLGLNADGTVVGVGDHDGSKPAGTKEHRMHDMSWWKNIVQVAAGDYHSVGLKSNGTVVAVGSNYYGQSEVTEWQEIVSVEAGARHTVGLKMDGTVVAVGNISDGQCDVSSWRDIVAISAGNYHTVGLKADGTVVAVGWNEYSQCDVSSWRDIVAVSAGNRHTVGLKADGTVVAVGSNEYGQCDVSSWRDIVAVSAGYHYTVGLKADGTVVTTGLGGIAEYEASTWTDIGPAK